MISKQDIRIILDGQTLAGWLYKTPEREKAPMVVMAHGFSAVKEMRLDAYAERFAEAGYHALVFDYRHFGGSQGRPRQLLDIEKQHDDWKAAIKFARSIPEVDGQKIVLWGTSFSGGHVMAVAAEDPTIAAVIAQVPHVSGFASALAVGFRQNFRLGSAAFLDRLLKLFNWAPYYVPAFGKPGEMAAMTAPGEYEKARKLYPVDSRIDDNVAARVFLSLTFYSPGKLASKVTAPMLVQVARNDLTTPPKPSIKAANRAPRGELKLYDMGHFDAYLPPIFDTVVQDQIDFLKKHVG